MDPARDGTGTTDPRRRLFDAALAPLSPIVEMTVVSGTETGRRVTLTGPEECLLGRSPGCAVRFDADGDRRVGGRHASVSFRDGGVWLGDLASRNGTRVNGERLVRPVRLHDGDVVELGSGGVRLAIRVFEPPPDLADDDGNGMSPASSEEAAQ